ncbi:MAG TPA: outer membrane beta-barrel protein [Xanthobacteraceae bacterium]|nr:outer membrane beta-barrel protein [Xanthobacteraceae bacterium]
MAADLPWLRGSSVEESPMPARGWTGFYGGVQAGGSIGSADFTSGAERGRVTGLAAGLLGNDPATARLENDRHVSQLLRVGKADTTGSHYGGFIGFNTGWDEGILGFEINYNFTSLGMTSANSIHGTFLTSDKFSDTITLSTASTVLLRDYATFRGRAGWEIGRFLPYVFAGFAAARADVSRSVTAMTTGIDAAPPPAIPRPPFSVGPTTASEIRENAFGFGYAAGIGVDVMLVSNLFMRAEWEYIGLGKFQDQTVHLSNVRAALGMKF